jgi:hypothetical protein
MSFVTVDDFKQYSGVFDDNAELQVYIDSAEQIVENYLGYSVLEKTYNDVLSGKGTSLLQLKARPITDITSILIDDGPVDLSNILYDKDEFITYKNNIFPCGNYNVEAEYTAGYALADIPELIKMTVMRIASLLQTESNQNIGVTSKSFADSGTRTFVNYTNFDKYLIQASKYKLIVI